MAPNADVVSSPDAKPSTTTMSLIGVRSGRDTTIVIAMLKSLGYLELRIDEMHPRLLDFGNDTESAGRLLYGHRDLITKLRSKQDQVEQLLAGADKLVTEQKTEDGVVVYEAMAESLGVAWRELNRQLDLRGYILEDTLRFYDHANKHAQAIGSIHNLLRAAAASGDPQAIANAQAGFNHLLDITAFTVDLGASIIRQVRVLGSLADNAERPAETANACLAIEHILLKLSQEWETIETVWNDEKERLGSVQLQQAPSQASAPSPRIDAKLADQLNSVETWLRHAHSDIAHGQTDQDTLNRLTAEGRQQFEYLGTLIAQAEAQNSEVLVVRGRELQNAVSTFLKSLEERSQLSNRIKTFLSNADTILSQLDKMEQDLSNASAAIAGELAPLAKQKTSAVIDEGQQILAVRRSIQVSDKLVQLTGRLSQIEKLARNRIQTGNKILKTQITNLTTWMKDVAEPFLASSGNVGHDVRSSTEFVTSHRQFIQEVVNKEQEVNTLLNRAHELSTEDRRQLAEFEQRYENLKQTLDARSQLGHNFQQVQRFSQELDSSFQTLSNLFDSNRDFSNRAVSEQMSHVITMVSDTLNQEREQANQFIHDAKTLAAHDVHLNCDAAVDSVRNNVVRHQEVLEEVRQKWQNWERAVVETRTATKTIEEVQMWQVDTFEVIRTLEERADKAVTVEERVDVHERAEEKLQELPVQQQKLDQAHRIVTEKQNEQTRLNIQRAAQQQREAEKRETHKSITEQQSEIRRVNVERAPESQPIPRFDNSRQTVTEQQTEIQRVNISHTPEPRPEPTHKTITEQQSEIQRINHERAPEPQPSPRYDESRNTVTEQQSEIQRVNIERAPQPQPRYDQTYKSVTEQQSEIQRVNIDRTPEPRLEPTHKTITEQQSEIQRVNIDRAPEPPRRADKTHKTITEQQSLQSRFNIQQSPVPQPEPEKRAKTVTEKQNEESLLNIERANRTQRDIENRLKAVQTKVTTTQTVETFHQHDSHQLRQSAPRQIPEVFDAASTKTVESYQQSQQYRQDASPQIPQHYDATSTKTVESYQQQQQYRQSPQVPVHHDAASTRTVESYQQQDSQQFRQDASPRPAQVYDNTSTKTIETFAHHDSQQLLQNAPPQVPQHFDAASTKTVESFQQQQQYRQSPQVPVQHDAASTRTVESYQQQDLQKFRQDAPQQPAKTYDNTTTKTTETYHQHDSQQLRQSAPRLVTELHDAVVDEGARFEFAARVEAEPEPKVKWTKDGIDIKSNVDYRQKFINGVATLSIEETFIEDSAVYTLRVENPLGSAESSARLTVKSKSVLGGQLDEAKPRFVKQLNNVTVTEGETARLDTVVVAVPEPKVTWYKEETLIQEDERIKLEFRGDNVSLVINSAQPTDTGLYKVSAKNEVGETTNFAKIHVSPRKVPPPTAPKPKTPIPEAPAFSPSLVNQTITEGETAVFQVRTIGSPPPKVTWKFKEAPVTLSKTVKIEEESNGWSKLSIENASAVNTGLYTVEAINESGIARSGATLIVSPVDNAPRHGIQQRSVTMIQSEGFWSDGAYTAGTPTPPPVPQHKITTNIEEFHQQDATEVGFSSIANAPDFVRPFQSEYTINEGEKSQIECLLVANPRPKVHWYFNDAPIKSNWQFAEFINIGDTYSIVLSPAKLENAGYYRMEAENIKGKAVTNTVIHVRPRSLIPQPTTKPRKPHTIEHQRVYETFGAVDYNEIVTPKHKTVSESFGEIDYNEVVAPKSQIPQKHAPSTRVTPPPAKRVHVPETHSIQTTQLHESGGYTQERQRQIQNQITNQQYGTYESSTNIGGTPPHFVQTLVSSVTTVGESAKFEGVVTGAPAPEIIWTKDGVTITKQTHPHLEFSNIGGRISLTFPSTDLPDSGKYMCSAKNASGVATSSAQLVVRAKTVAPDFIKRLISEEIVEGERLRWTVRVTGDPAPKVTWLRDGIVIPSCPEVQLVDEGAGHHSMIIEKVQLVDSGQFTCLAENSAGEARSTADLVVRPAGAEPGAFFHVTKVTQERQVKGEEVSRNQTFSIENPRATPTRL
uniref:HPt domain-containing protein n=1 Tax=Panagrellus redivivus TaxID=6233 RepID=A0A7E4VLM8_PANRE